MQKGGLSDRVLNEVRRICRELGEFTARDVKYRVMLAPSTVNRALSILVNNGELEVTRRGPVYRYRYVGGRVVETSQSSLSSFDNSSNARA